MANLAGTKQKRRIRLLFKTKKGRGRLMFWSTCDVSPNADQDECQKSSR